MKIRHFLLCLVVGVSLFAWGCAPLGSGADYLVQGGRGEVSGKMGDVEFVAVVEISGGGKNLCVEYLSPDSLCGLVLTLEGELCEVRVGEIIFASTPEEVAGLLRPATAFLTHGDAKTVQREGENTVLTFPDGSILTRSPKGEPLSLVREDMNVRVVWWEGEIK